MTDGSSKRFAVIGAGVSGLSAAWLLSKKHDVVLYEREDRLGGGDLTALEARLKNPRVADIILVLHALLLGGGGSAGAGLTLEALKASDLDLGEATRAIARAFESLGDDDAPGKSALGKAKTNGA